MSSRRLFTNMFWQHHSNLSDRTVMTRSYPAVLLDWAYYWLYRYFSCPVSRPSTRLGHVQDKYRTPIIFLRIFCSKIYHVPLFTQVNNKFSIKGYYCKASSLIWGIFLDSSPASKGWVMFSLILLKIIRLFEQPLKKENIKRKSFNI